jgi:putative ABC transport system substrate-binding protein
MNKIFRSRFFAFPSDNPKSKSDPADENRKWGGIFAVAFALVFGAAVAEAQQPTKIPRIGFQSASTPAALSARVGAFQLGLRELRYVEGKSISVEYRYAEGKLDRLDEFAAEFVRSKVDIIVTAAPGPTRAAKKATSTIPIVMAWDNDPVGNGFVASLARPGGNITGLSSFAPEISGKQLELLKETVPRLSHVAVIGSSNPLNAPVLKEVELAGRALKLKLQFLVVRGQNDIDTAFREARKGRAGAVLVLSSPILEAHRTEVADFAAKNRLPAIYHATEYVEAGGLMFYGASIPDLYHRAATYVDKIFKGRAPTDLPVEQPMKFEFIISLIAAKRIGLTIPPNVLVRADRVIR